MQLGKLFFSYAFIRANTWTQFSIPNLRNNKQLVKNKFFKNYLINVSIILQCKTKLDRAGSIDNRPSTNSFHNFVKKKITCDT